MAHSDKNMSDQILTTLSSAMSSDITIRKGAEAELQILEVTEDFCVHLAKITVDQSYDPGLRQLGSLILKRYVDTHWNPLSEKFKSPEASESAKIAIRQMLPLGLGDPQHKIRTGVAYAVSAIASWDWPEQWPGLFDCLMQGLASEEPCSVHGAMRVLTEFIREVTDLHMVKVIPALLPEMYKIITDDRYDVRVRCRAVAIFNTCASFTVEISDQKADLHHSFITFIPSFLDAFVKILKSDRDGLIKEILRATSTLIRGFEKEFRPIIPQILPVVWSIFTKSSEMYVKREVISSEGHDDEVDSDGEGVGFENVVYNTFDLIECMLEMRGCRHIVEQSLEDLIFHLITFMQVTEEQILSWSENPDQFVQDEDDDTFSYNIRISAQDLFLSCCKGESQDIALKFFRAVERHILIANEARAANHPCWWKSYEALMLAIGSVEQMISKTIQAGNANFNVGIFINSIVLPSIKAADFPFLVGRAIWVASRFAGMLQADVLTHFLEYTVQGLKEDQPPAIRISAVRAACNFCEYLQEANATDRLFPYCDSLLQGLVQLALQAPVETLALVLEAISIVAKVNKSVSALHEPHISSLCLTVFFRHYVDPFVISLCTDLFEIMAAIEACNRPLLEHTMPVIADILAGNHDKTVGSFLGNTLELLTVIIRGTPPPFPDMMITMIFPAVVNAVTATDDSSVIQYGGDCVRAFVSKASQQILAWSDRDGMSGWHYVLRVTSHMLDPQVPPHSAAFIGRLVGVMIREFGSQLHEVLSQLLRAALSKLQQAQTVTVVQSLLMIFAYLLKNDLASTLDFLMKVPGPTGNSAFEFVMSQWCEKQALFFGEFDTKLCTLALSDLFKHSMSANDDRINKIVVRGEQIFDDSSTIRTRSKSKKEPEKWTTIPLTLKLLKLLIMELGHALDLGEGEDKWEDEDEEEEDDGRLSLSQILDSCDDRLTAEDFMGEEESDPDVLSDPLYQISLKDYLLEYFGQFCRSSVYRDFFVSQLNKTETDILARCGLF